MSELKSVHTDGAPAALGPYSQAIVVDGFVFASGQVAIDPATGEVVEGGVAEQTDRVLTNLSAVLEAAGASMSTVVKATVFLTDMGTFAEMNEVWDAWVSPGNTPGRACVESRLAAQRFNVEIGVIAAVD